MTNKTQNTAYQVVTDRVIALLKDGVVPWQRPWDTTDDNGTAINLKRKTAYRGLNAMLLPCLGFTSRYWVTRKDAESLGGRIKQEHWYNYAVVVFWDWYLPKAETVKPEADQKRVPFLKYYRVWNVEQTEGLDKHIPKDKKAKKLDNSKVIVQAEQIVKDYLNKPRISHGGNSAYYSPANDYIIVPERGAFRQPEEYYSTLYHELVHSTGAKNRLGRFVPDCEAKLFTKNSYGEEELIAEMGNSYLCAKAGILDRTIDNSAGYIDGWIKRLQADEKLLVKACSRAMKAVDYITDSPEPAPQPQPIIQPELPVQPQLSVQDVDMSLFWIS